MTKYHAASNDWSEGEAIYSFGELERMGCEPVWKWECEPFDTEWVSLADTFAEAAQIARDFGLTRVLAIDWDAVNEDCCSGVNSEGYSVIGGRIPAEYIVEIITI